MDESTIEVEVTGEVTGYWGWLTDEGKVSAGAKLEFQTIPWMSVFRLGGYVSDADRYNPDPENSVVVHLRNQLPLVTIEPAWPEANEGDDAIFTLTRYGDGLAAPRNETLTVTVNVTGAGGVYNGPAQRTVTFEAGAETAELRIPTRAVESIGTMGTVTAALASSPTVYRLTDKVWDSGSRFDRATVDVAEVPLVSILATADQVDEGGRAVFTLSRASAGVSGVLIVAVTVRDLSGSLYLNERVTFRAGESTATLTVPIPDDRRYRPKERITATLSPGGGYRLASPGHASHPSEASMAVQENDRLTVSISRNQASVTEGEDARFTVTRNGVSGDLRVHLRIGGHGKIMSEETRAIASRQTESGAHLSVLIEDGSETATLALTTEADDISEGNGELSARLVESPVPYRISGPGGAAVLVEDDDIRTVSLEWITPSDATLDESGTTWEATVTEGQPIGFRLVCSGSSGTTVDTQTLIGVFGDSRMNHPLRPEYNVEASLAFLCQDGLFGALALGNLPGVYQERRIPSGAGSGTHWASSRYVGPANGLQVFRVLSHEETQGGKTGGRYYLENEITLIGSCEDDFCPKYVLTGPTAARITVLNRNPTITITAQSGPVVEGGVASFTLRRLWNEANLTYLGTRVVLTITGDGASVAGSPTAVVTFAPGESEKTIEITSVDDEVRQPDGSITVEIVEVPDVERQPMEGAYETYEFIEGVTPPGGNSKRATVTVTDNDGSTPVVTVEAVRDAVEEGEDVVLRLTRRGGDVSQALFFNISTLVTRPDQSVTDPPKEKAFEAGEATLELTYQGVSQDDDAVNDLLEAPNTIAKFRATLNPGEGYEIGQPSSAEVRVFDNDVVSTGVALSVSPMVVAEDAGATAVTVTAKLNGLPRDEDTAVAVTVTPGSASAGDDFADVSGFTVTIPVGARSGDASFNLTPVDDHLVEGDETLDAAGSATGLTVRGTTLTITDNDEPPTAVTLSVNPATVGEGVGDTTVTVTVRPDSGTWPEPRTVIVLLRSPSTVGASDSDYSTSPGLVNVVIEANATSGAASFTLTPVDDERSEGDEEILVTILDPNLSVTPATLTITDNDVPGVTVSPLGISVTEGQKVTYTVQLNTQPEESVTVTPRSSDPEAATVSGPLVFRQRDWAGPRQVTVTGVSDVDTNNETVTVSHTVSGYGDINEAAAVTVTVTDDNTAGVVVSETHIEVREGGGKNYAVVLTSEPSGQVTVTPSSDDPTAASVSGALTFTTDNWNMIQWVTVIGVQDADAIDDTATITHTVVGYGPAATAAGVTVAVDDDDQPPEVTVRARSESVTEGEEAVFIFNRTGDTSYALTAEFRNIVRIGDENVSNDPAQVTFQTDSDSAEFTVATEDDNLANMQPTKYRARVANGEGYTKGEPGTATVTATDDDEASTGFILAVAPRRVREGDGETEIVLTVALNASPRAEETLFVVSGNGSDEGEGATATTDVDFMLTPSPQVVTIPAGETSATGAFLLTLTDDNLLEGDETVVFSGGTHESIYQGSTELSEVETARVTIVDNDTPGVSVSRFRIRVTEGRNKKYAIRLDSQPTGNVTVTPESAEGEAVAVSGALTFTPDDWDEEKQVTVSGVQDDDSNDEEVTVTHAVSGADYGGVAAPDVAVSVQDDDGITVSVEFESAEVSVLESAGTVRIDVIATTDADHAPSNELRVPIASADGTATAGSDYAGVGGAGGATVLVFELTDFERVESASGHVYQARQTLDIAILDDELMEGDEIFSVLLGPFSDFNDRDGPDVAMSAGPEAIVTITEDDLPPITLTLDPDRVSEGTRPALVSVTVTLNEDMPNTRTLIHLKIGDGGTAVQGVDYSIGGLPSVLVLRAGQRSGTASLTLWPVGDAIDEVDETLIIAATVNADPEETSAVLTLADDDSAGVTVHAESVSVTEGSAVSYNLALTSQPGQTVSVLPVSSDPDLATVSGVLIFTPENWSDGQPVTVTGVHDADGVDERVNVTHEVAGYGAVTEAAAVAVIVTDDDEPGVEASQTQLEVPEGGSARYTIVLNTQPTTAVTVIPVSDADVATVSGALTFTRTNWFDAQPVTVTGVQDPDAANEAVSVTHRVLSSEEYADLETPTVQATVIDDEEVSRAVTLTLNPELLDEGDPAKVVTVSASLNAAPRTTETAVSVTVTGGTATAETDFEPVSGFTLTIPQGSTSTTGTFTLTTVGDELDEDDETVEVNGSVSAAGLTLFPATLTIQDDDTRGVTVSETSLSFSEGGSETYKVVLTSQPTEDVTVDVIVPQGTDVSAIPTSLTFTPETWGIPKTVTVSAAKDDDSSVDATVIITHSVSGGDYDGETASDVEVMIGETTPAFTEGNTTTRSLPENSPQGTSVGAAVTATDPDEGDTLTYGITGPNPGGFTIHSTTAQLRSGPAENYDFEDPTKNTYTVTVTATDPHGADASIEVTVTVSDLDEPPGQPVVSITDQTRTSLTVEWTAPDNTGRPAITDYDIEYRQTSDTDWTDHPHQGTSLTTVIDPLTPGTEYLVRVLARNHEGQSPWSNPAQGTTVTNSPPNFGTATANRSVPENSPQGTNVGAAVTATDADNDTLTYSITGPNPGGFTIHSTTAQLRSGPAENYDFEDPTKNTYTVTVTATDPHEASASIEVTITVTDTDEPPDSPTVSISDGTRTSLTVEWDAPDNAGRPAITDYDVEYRKVTDPLSSWNSDAEHEGTGLSITLTDLSPGTDYQVRVLARNHEGQSPWSNPAQGTTVANRPPEFGANTAGRSVPENSPQGTTVGAAITATDPDDGDTLTYSITGPNPGGFTIHSTSGQLLSGPAENYDFEDSAKDSYAVTVTATDPHGGSASTDVTITVTDENEPPDSPTVSISGQTRTSLTVEWDAPDNAGRPAITDYDVEYRKVTDPLSSWNSDAEHDGTGLSITLTDLTPGTDYQVRVLARNHEGQSPWSNPAQGTTVTNRPPEFGANTNSRSVPENSPQGTTVGAAITATDPDDGDTLTYSITGPNPGGFTIDSTSGQLLSGPAENYDFENQTKNSYTVTVTATDPHEGSADIAVTITVTDENEPPDSPTVSISDGTRTSLTVEWTAPDNAGRPAITDYDVEYRKVTDPLSSWNSDTEHDGTGLSTTLTELTPGTEYQVRVLARNHEGQSPWSNPAQGTTVTNRPPEFEANTNSRSVPENSPQGTTVGAAITATDPDDGDTLTYSITGPNPGGFTIDSTSGQLLSGPAENYDFENQTKNSYTVTVTATDPHEGSADIAVTITVTDTDEPPDSPTVSISDGTRTSLTVEWTAPDNAGRPAITDYDVEYRKVTDPLSSWNSDAEHDGTGLSTTLTELTPGTEYQVRVLARNHEGQSPWSNPAQGTTVTNRPPEFEANTNSRSVPENSPQGTTVGAAITATDPDDGDTLTYSITGPNPGGFTIDSTSGQLLSGPAENYDFENQTKNSYTVTVTATDSRGASDSIPVTVTVTDLNEPPAFAESNPTRQLAENTGNTAFGAPVTASDPDAGDTLTYSITGPNPGGFTVHSTTAQLLSGPAENYDFEDPTKNSYTVTVTATDSRGASDSIPVTVTVTDLNEPPAFAESNPTRQLAENTGNTAFGAPVTASDPDAGDTLTYSITGPNPGGFTIDSTSGQLLSGPAERYDFEDPTKNSYTVTVTATDSRGASDSIPVTVTVTDLNEPPAFAESNPTRQLAENTGNTAFGAPVTASDPDAGDTLTYSITGPNPGGFTVHSTTAQLLSGPAENYDFEDPTKNTYTVTVTATDPHGADASIEVTVTVTDLNEPPAFAESNPTRQLAENTGNTAFGAPVTASDPDAGDTLTYSITGPNPGGFTVHSTTAQLLSGPAENYDFEDPTKNTYTVTVTATDSQGADASIEVTVAVTDVDEPPGQPVVSISDQTRTSLTVRWTAPDNAGRPAIEDYDVEYRRAEDLDWTVHPHDGTGLTALIGSLISDREYLVQVRAGNDEGRGEWSEPAQSATLANRGPIFPRRDDDDDDENPATRSLPENSPVGTFVGAAVVATDPDAGDTLTYSITGTNPGGFTIDSTTGQLRSGPAERYDFEDPTKNSYTVTVTATDGQGGSASIEVTVTVTDVNEAPAFAESDPTRQLAENTGNTALGALLSASDPDAGDTLTYSITGPNPGGFTIHSTTAQLRSGPAENYDFEDPTKNTYTVTVTATDSQGADASIEVTVTVTDTDEPPGQPVVSISDQTRTSLTVEWTAPDNTGRPAISDYDVEYRVMTDPVSSWSDAGHEGTGAVRHTE